MRKKQQKLVRILAIVMAIMLAGGAIVSIIVELALNSSHAHAEEALLPEQTELSEHAEPTSAPFAFRLFRMDGSSMKPTLSDGERLYVTIFDMRSDSVARGELVVCRYPTRGDTNFVKRVIGVPGDSVYRKNGVTHVVYELEKPDGTVEQVDEMLDERYAEYFANGSEDDYAPYTLGEDEYFVVGDNRYNSHDSRDWNDSNDSADVGPITRDMLVGRVERVVWPLSAARAVE